jgi:hypothetical protein
MPRVSKRSLSFRFSLPNLCMLLSHSHICQSHSSHAPFVIIMIFGTSTHYKAPHYAILSRFSLFFVSKVQIISPALCSQNNLCSSLKSQKYVFPLLRFTQTSHSIWWTWNKCSHSYKNETMKLRKLWRGRQCKIGFRIGPSVVLN